jgi:hypothetical protein
MRRPGEAVHRAVAQYLALALPSKGAWFAHVPNGGGRTKAEGGILKALGVKAGVPDLLIVHRGRAHWLELKAPPRLLKNGTPSKAKPAISDEQEETMRQLQRAGCEVGICRSLGEVQALLTQWGIV